VRRAWRPLALALVLVGAFPLVDAGRGHAAGDGEPVSRKSPNRTELIGSASARVAAVGPIVGGLNLEAGFARSAVDLSGDASRGESATLPAGAATVLGGSSAASIDEEGARSSAAVGEVRLGCGTAPVAPS
jgi:hypothetical protein